LNLDHFHVKTKRVFTKVNVRQEVTHLSRNGTTWHVVVVSKLTFVVVTPAFHPAIVKNRTCVCVPCGNKDHEVFNVGGLVVAEVNCGHIIT
jgi:hypothetical protein